MLFILVLAALGVILQAVVLATTKTTYPHYTGVCTKCGYRLPPMEQPIAIEDCPGCKWLYS